MTDAADDEPKEQPPALDSEPYMWDKDGSWDDDDATWVGVEK